MERGLKPSHQWQCIRNQTYSTI